MEPQGGGDRGPGETEEDVGGLSRAASTDIDVAESQIKDVYVQHVDPSTFCTSELQRVSIMELHPTQLAVGMQQVHTKRERVVKLLSKKNGQKKLKTFMKEHPIPVVKGPGGVMYLIDHHHLGSALLAEGVKEAYIIVVRDMSQYPEKDFWRWMMSRNYLWPYDETGRKLAHEGDAAAEPSTELIDLLPSSLAGMRDDPYRSLAGLLRKAGGFQKDWAPFAEFKWANYLRSRVPISSELPADHPSVLEMAVRLAWHQDAAQAGLPGVIVSSPSNAADAPA